MMFVLCASFALSLNQSLYDDVTSDKLATLWIQQDFSFSVDRYNSSNLDRNDGWLNRSTASANLRGINLTGYVHSNLGTTATARVCIGDGAKEWNWASSETGPANGYCVSFGADPYNTYYMYKRTASNTNVLSSGSIPPLEDNTSEIQFYHNDSMVILKINGTLITNVSDTSYTFNAATSYFILDEAGGSNRCAWNVFEVYDVTNLSSETPAAAGTATILLISPSDNDSLSSNNVDFISNITYNNLNITNCSLYTNSTGSWLANATNTSAITNNTNYTFSSIALANGNHLWNVVCCNVSNTCFTGTNNYTIIIDTEPPTSINGYINNTFYFLKNITGQFNFSDNNLLYSYNITIDGVQIDGKTDLDTVFYVYNLSYNVTNLTIGEHQLSIRVADAHTDEVLKDGEAYNPSKCLFKDCLKYDFAEPYDTGSLSITQKEGSIFDRWDTQQLKDRYTFTFEPATQKTQYTFVVTSDSYIDIIDAPKTKYKQWLIYNDHWVDFYPYTTTVKRIDDTQVEVTVYGVDPTQDIITFQSIGDLNIVYYNYTFYTTNATVSYSSTVSELENQTMTLIIYKPSPITSTYANLFWNGSMKNTTKVDFGTYDYYSGSFVTTTVPDAISTVNFYWNYSINSPYSNENGTINNAQTVFKMLIDNCSSYNISAINFTLKDDNTSQKVVGNLKGYFEIWSTSREFNTPFNISWGGRSNYSLCLFNSSQLYNVYSQMEYSSDNYSTETYYLYNTTLDNNTRFIDLLFTASSTLVTFTVTDENDAVVQGAYIHIVKYDLPTDTGYTTEILKTSSSGTDIGHIVLDNAWYKFFIYFNNEMKFESQPTKISTTSKAFRISRTVDYISSYNQLRSILTSLSFNNTTKVFSYTFTDPSGLSNIMCLKVTKKTPLSDTIINDTCVTSTSGLIMVDIGTDVGTATYIAMGYQQGSVHPTDLLGIDFDQGYKEWGKDAIFATFFLRLAVVMIGIWSPIIAIILLVITDFGMLTLGLLYMNITTMTVYILLAIITIWRISRK
jgi:hypothetical protein